MRSLGQLLLIATLGLSLSAVSADGADPDATRSLIIARLLGQIDWKSESFNAKSSSDYVLCTYKNFKSYRSFNNVLKKVEIQGRPVSVRNVTEREEVGLCHALFFSQVNETEIDWFNTHLGKKSTIFIAEESPQNSKLNAHVKIFLNKSGFFDFLLFPDEFVASAHVPRVSLLSLAEIKPGKVNKDIKKIHNLIRYTEWTRSEKGQPVSGPLTICTFPGEPLYGFLALSLNKKQINARDASVKSLSPSLGLTSQTQECSVLILPATYADMTERLIRMREQRNLLLIGQDLTAGSLGAHYNLSLPENDSRAVEINLLAFKTSQMVPNYQLLNSARLVEVDYPLVAEKLFTIATNTVYLNGQGKALKNKSVWQDDMQLCTLQSEENFALLKATISASDRYLGIELKQLTDLNQAQSCGLIYVEQSLVEQPLNVAQSLIVYLEKESAPVSAIKPFAQIYLKASANELTIEPQAKNLMSSGFNFNQDEAGKPKQERRS